MMLHALSWRAAGSVKAIASALIAVAALSQAGACHAADRIASKTIRVSDARIGTTNEKTRFVLDLTGPVSFSTRTLTRPPRLVIDMPNVDFKLAPEAGAGGGIISAYRYGLIAPEKSRVVLDLRAPIRVMREFLFRHESGIYRLVIDLAAAASAPIQKSPPAIAKTAQAAQAAPRREPIATSRPAKTMSPIRGPKSPLVVIDPGHGGPDPGTVSAQRRKEKWVVLEFAKRLKAELNFRGIRNVELTRNKDVFVPLAERAEFARRQGAALFLSIHADSIDKAKAATTSGATVYTLSKRGSDAQARALALRENASDIVAGFDAWEREPEVSAILVSLLQNQTNQKSSQLAGRLLKHLHGRIQLNRRPHRTANFAVLRTRGIPAVLLELGYLSNAADEARLVSGRWQIKAAKTVACAIIEHMKPAADPAADCAR